MMSRRDQVNQLSTSIHPKPLTIWLLRGLLGVLFLFGSEILLWIDPPGRDLTEWLLLIPGYIALGALALDLAARYRIRSIYELMTVAAVYGLLNGLLLNPQTAFADFPRTLATRVVGGHTLVGFEMLGLFLALTAGQMTAWRWRFAGFALWVGFYWGIWVRWSPVLTDWLDAEVLPVTMFAWAGAILAVAAVFFIFLARRASSDKVSSLGDLTAQPPLGCNGEGELSAAQRGEVRKAVGTQRYGLSGASLPDTPALTLSDLCLSPLSWSVLLMVLIVLFLAQAIRESYTDYGVVPVIGGIIGLCIVVLWFQRSDKSRTVLDHSIPPTPLRWSWIGVVALVFAASTILAYHLPLVMVAGYNQLSLMEFGFAGVGFLWFPLIAGVIGGRALERQSRKLNL